MKLKLFSALCAAALITQTFAEPPKKCPSVSSVQSSGLHKFAVYEDYQDHTWLVANIKNDYDTSEYWSFIVSRIKATNENEAYTKASASLDSLSFKQGPILIKTDIDRWACLYSTDAGYSAMAITPDILSNFSRFTNLPTGI